MYSIDSINIDLEVKNNSSLLLYGILFGYFIRLCDVICDKNDNVIETKFKYISPNLTRNQILKSNSTLVFNNKQLYYNKTIDSYMFDNYAITLRNCGTNTHSEIIYMKRIELYLPDYNKYFNECNYNNMICDINNDELYKYLVWSEFKNNIIKKKINVDVKLEDKNTDYYYINIKKENISILIYKNDVKINNIFYYDYYNIKIKHVYIQNISYNNIIQDINDNKYNNNNNNNNNIKLYILYIIIIIILSLLYILFIIIKYIKNKTEIDKKTVNYIELDII
ncbi:similar to DNA gyrase subunit B [Betaentomopoxvirus amoorei]|uniref:AMV264 n=1 Tax=Amsacta moorei entomopoxvirus TaxID=28321 RepID=Q9EME2_AMEPV|nr:similar to DNA gyrase subunit B [Amsacta moorei entomopoxvirus]AAG02970.1 AMV264 [Amsacta moorei entomopoxvirus]